MSTRLSRIVALVLAAVLCLSLIPAAFADEDIVLEWFVDDVNSANAYPKQGSLVEQVIYEKTGVRVHMTFAATTDHDQFNQMVAGDMLPDIVSLSNNGGCPNLIELQMAQEGMIYSYQELDTLAPGLLDTCRPDVLAWWSHADGKTYSYPGAAYSDVDTPNNPRARQPESPISMRRDLWEQLGCPDISTPDGFLDACVRAEKEIGQYNGYDIIGFQCWPGVINSISLIEQYFSVPFEDEDGNYTPVWYQPLYREVLGFFNKAYRLGVLKESNFSEQNDTVAEHVTQGRVFALITNPSSYGSTGMIPLYKTDNNATYFLPVLGNSQGTPPHLKDPTSWGNLPTVVTKSSKHPAECAKLLRFLISDEAQILLFAGVEGETFTWNEDHKIVTNYDSTKAAELGLNTMFPIRNYSYYMSQYPFDPNSYTAGYINKSDMIPYSYSRKALFKVDPTDDREVWASEVSTKINNEAVARYGKMITAETEEEFNALYDETIEILNSLGLEELTSYNNEKFQRAKDSLGVKYLWPEYLEK